MEYAGIKTSTSPISLETEKVITSALHATASVAKAYADNSFLPIINTALFNTKQYTNLLESKNWMVQCGIDAATSLSNLVTFNLIGAATAAGLTGTKCFIKAYNEESRAIPIIEATQSAANFFYTSHWIIKAGEALKYLYSLKDIAYGVNR